jgi:two-component system sensor histidine kinase KdpD
VTKRLLHIIAIIPAVPLLTGVIYLSHGKALTAGLIELVLLMLIAFRWGFPEAAVTSVLAVACLDYFYMAPIFFSRRERPSGLDLIRNICDDRFDGGSLCRPR